MPDEAFYFLNLATLGEPDVTMGHSSPASHLVSASKQLLTSMPLIPRKHQKGRYYDSHLTGRETEAQRIEQLVQIKYSFGFEILFYLTP